MELGEKHCLQLDKHFLSCDKCLTTDINPTQCKLLIDEDKCQYKIFNLITKDEILMRALAMNAYEYAEAA